MASKQGLRRRVRNALGLALLRALALVLIVHAVLQYFFSERG